MNTFTRNKIAVSALSILFVLSMIASITQIPDANAHTPAWQIPTYSFLNVSPNPVGVGQTVNVNFWLSLAPPTASGPYGDRWKALTIIVTKPDGSNQTLGPFTTDDTGGTFTTFTPNVIGNYTFCLLYAGETLANSNTK